MTSSSLRYTSVVPVLRFYPTSSSASAAATYRSQPRVFTRQFLPRWKAKAMNCWALAYLALQRSVLFCLTYSYRNEERKNHSPRLRMTITVVSLNSTVSWSMHNTRTARKALLVSASSAIPPLSLSSLV